MVYCVFISALNQQVPSKGATNYDIMTCSNINDFAVFTCRPVWCLFSGYNCGFDYWKWIGFQWIFISRHHQLGATSESNSISSAVDCQIHAVISALHGRCLHLVQVS